MENFTKVLKNKKADTDLAYEAIIFLFLNFVFISVIFVSSSRIANGSGILEQVYAKKIALIIDMAKPGTFISLDLNELFKFADKNRVSRVGVVKIDNENHEIYVRVDKGQGYYFKFFNDYPILWEIKKKSAKLEIEIKQKISNNQNVIGKKMVVDKNV